MNDYANLICWLVKLKQSQLWTFAVDPEIGRRQAERLARVKRGRDAGRAEAALARLGEAARGSENLMGPIGEAVEAYATVGEITGVLREIFGEFQEPAAF